MKDTLFALLISIVLVSIHYLLFGNSDPWGIVIYFLVLAVVKVDNLNKDV